MKASECLRGHEWIYVLRALAFFRYEEVTDENAQEISDYLNEYDPYDGDTITTTVYHRNKKMGITTTVTDKSTPALNKKQQGAFTLQRPFQRDPNNKERILYNGKRTYVVDGYWRKNAISNMVTALNFAYQRGFAECSHELLSIKEAV